MHIKALACELPAQLGMPLSRLHIPDLPSQALTQGAVGLRGVWCRSATKIGRELAWFPAMGSVVRPAWPQPQPYGSWRYATTLDDVGVRDAAADK